MLNDGIALLTNQATVVSMLITVVKYHGSFEHHGIGSLATCVKNIYSPIYFKDQLNSTKRFASWNRFPKYVTTKIIN